MTLGDYLQNEGCFKDFYVFQQFLIKLNNAIKIINQKNVLHRDIKPDNIFIKIINNEYIPILADFGIARYYSEKIDYNVPYERDSQRYTGSVGTYHYISPEILKQEPYNNKCDLYSLGVTIYMSVFRILPYYRMHEIIHCDKLNLLKTGIESLDDLIERLLEINPAKRIDFEEYFNHKFFKESKAYLQQCINKNIRLKEEQIIYCINTEKYSHYITKCNKIRGIFSSQQYVVNFINEYSSINIQPFPYTRLLTFHDYKYKYFQRHQKISKYYGDFTNETYEKADENIKNFIKDEKEENLKVKDKNKIEESFKIFDLDKDLKTLDEMLINLYTKDTLYGDLNNWLRSLKTDV